MAHFAFVLAAAALAASPTQSGAAPGAPRADAVEEGSENEARLAQLGLLPFRRHGEVIRYSFGALEFSNGRATGIRQVVVQLAPAAGAGGAELLVVTGRGPLRGPLRAGERRHQTISREEYRSLRSQLVRIATDLDLVEQDVGTAVTVCSHVPWVRFDMKLGGESRFVLSRDADCRREATAYRAGEFLTVAAERILGAPVVGVSRSR